MADAPPPQSPKDARKQAKADAAAAKARAKAERPIWKKPWFWVLGIIVIAVIASIAGGGAEDGTTTGDTAQEDSADAGADEAETTGLGSPAEDGNFTFTVHAVECGETTIGNNQFTRTEANGEFCIAEMTVENHGDEASLMDGGSQYLYIDGKKYSADTDAIFADKRAEAFFVEEINPGLSVDGIVVWDVPPGSQPEMLELHDSPFSGGVEVNL